ncbi:MAG: PAAR domain-containing protein, partial [Deltaproteobacteria bacterium]|nr:PAAR domain-containing protein [Nannocystaceae bacterium]
MYLAPPHCHSHPPSLIPPAPPIPLPSIGMIMVAGCMSVLINGLPAARCGDYGLAPTCVGIMPIFEVKTGSSQVFIGGSRAARLLDFAKACPGPPEPPGPPAPPSRFAQAMTALGVAGIGAGLL